MLKARFKKMKNAYGIKNLNVNYKGDKILYQSLIYSSNGTFKTSFSRAIYNLSNGKKEEIIDRITGASSQIEIEFLDENDKYVTNDTTKKFIVFSRELYEDENDIISNRNQDISLLTTDKEKRAKLNKLMNDSLYIIIGSLNNKLKKAGLNAEKSIELLSGKTTEELDINDLQNIIEAVEATEEKDISLVNLKKLFQKPYDPIDNDNFAESAKNYIDIFNKRLNEELFDENFNDGNCLQVVDDLQKNYYLSKEKNRGIVLKGKPYYEYDEIRNLFIESIKNISDEPSVLAANRELMKSMGSSIEAAALKKEFKNNPMLINQLSLGKREIIKIALKKQQLDTEEYLKIIKKTKEEYKKIIEDALTKKSEFEKAVDIYMNRFNPVFKITIDNKAESILGENVPVLAFKHKNQDDVVLSELELRKILSSGEKTALNIINFIVEYEVNKNNSPILVLDDLVETFDYANRFAFIEYINDLINDNVSVIILTHNYEFYKNLSNRIKKLDKLSAYSTRGNVYIEENGALTKNMEKVFEIKNIEGLIFAIPYLREIKTMTKSNTAILNDCLHYKKDTQFITIGKIKNEFIGIDTVEYNENLNSNYLDVLYSLADNANVGNYYDIVSKTILSMACRLKIEQKIIGNKFQLIENITENQLFNIKNMYEQDLTDDVLKLIDRVQISTPEFIHCNAFMYEPLVDIKGDYLKEIYEDVKKFDSNNIWKQDKI